MKKYLNYFLQGTSMKKITEKKAKNLLKKYASNNRAFQIVLKHSLMVKKVALSIAKEIKNNGCKVNLELIKIGALLHDIGRLVCPPDSQNSIKHGVIGGEILRKEGLEEFARIAETHIGAGISKNEIKTMKLPLPHKNFIPKTIEEKIITYADNLIIDNKLRDFEDVLKRFKKEKLPESAVKRLLRLHKEIEKLRKKHKNCF